MKILIDKALGIAPNANKITTAAGTSSCRFPVGKGFPTTHEMAFKMSSRA